MNVLMIEDNESVCEMMSMFFEKEQFQGHFYHDGLEGYNAYAESPSKWDIVLLDINLPSMDGITICRNIRKISKETPIIMLTAQDSESDQVIGLEMGADDYVTKPFSPLTLMARMKALYRRSQIPGTDHSQTQEEEGFDVVTKSVKINTVTREAYYNNQLIENLTPKEFDLLLTFVRSTVSSCLSSSGKILSMATSGPSMLILRNYGRRLKSSGLKLFRLSGASATSTKIQVIINAI